MDIIIEMSPEPSKCMAECMAPAASELTDAEMLNMAKKLFSLLVQEG